MFRQLIISISYKSPKQIKEQREPIRLRDKVMQSIPKSSSRQLRRWSKSIAPGRTPAKHVRSGLRKAPRIADLIPDRIPNRAGARWGRSVLGDRAQDVQEGPDQLRSLHSETKESGPQNPVAMAGSTPTLRQPAVRRCTENLAGLQAMSVSLVVSVYRDDSICWGPALAHPVSFGVASAK